MFPDSTLKEMIEREKLIFELRMERENRDLTETLIRKIRESKESS